MASTKLYLRPFNGNMVISYNNRNVVIKDGEEIILEYLRGHILVNKENTKDIHISKKNISTLVGISKDGKNFRKLNFSLKMT